MEVKWRTKILQLGITYILSATSLLAQKENFVPANDVSFTVSTERRSYTLKYLGLSSAHSSRAAGRAARGHVGVWSDHRNL